MPIERSEGTLCGRRLPLDNNLIVHLLDISTEPAVCLNRMTEQDARRSIRHLCIRLTRKGQNCGKQRGRLRGGPRDRHQVSPDIVSGQVVPTARRQEYFMPQRSAKALSCALLFSIQAKRQGSEIQRPGAPLAVTANVPCAQCRL